MAKAFSDEVDTGSSKENATKQRLGARIRSNRIGKGSKARLLVVSLTLVVLPAAAMAQADATGTGGGPLSTQTAPNTTSVGVTKPPSRDASRTWRDNSDRRTRKEQEDDKIENGICIGCEPK